MTNSTIQRPTAGFDWLYKDDGNNRIFAKEVILPDGVPMWAECTNEEKEQWDAEHPQPEDEQAE